MVADAPAVRHYSPVAPLIERMAEQWRGLIADCTGDELSEGGQSLRELERIEKFEAFLATCPQVEIPTFHRFADGIYMREIHAPTDSIILGYEHKHECLNIMSKGRVLTLVNGQIEEFAGQCVVKSGARTRKASIVVEDMIWATVHPNPDNENDIAKLEERYLIKTKLFLAHAK